jgi:hypothetical protein
MLAPKRELLFKLNLLICQPNLTLGEYSTLALDHALLISQYKSFMLTGGHLSRGKEKSTQM